MKILLNALDWKLKGFWPYVPLLGKSIELKQDLMGVTEWIEASVPGGVHRDLLNAGLIKDPYFERNSLECEWVENRWWMYKASFTFRQNHYHNIKLVFEGVDNKAYFFLNGKKLGEHEGCYEPAVFDVTGLVSGEGENELTVLCEQAPQEMSQIGYTSKTSTQKSRFNYKWDFSTRLVNIGIWGDVYLEVSKEMAIEDAVVRAVPQVGGKGAEIEVKCQIRIHRPEDALVVLNLYKDSLKIAEREIRLERTSERETAAVKECFSMKTCELWYPNGYGEQPMYRAGICVYCKGEETDSQNIEFGIKSIRYQKNEDAPEDALPYMFEVNGRRVYIKGANLVPFDHLYGTVTKEQYETYIRLLKYANINLVRVWGGGIIEKEIFYDLCDRHGIMVWQEFIQSSSGIDNSPSEDEKFLDILSKTAVCAVKRIRNHVCRVVWSGGNELRDRDDAPVTYENPNIRMLQKIVDTYDPETLFLPSSASGPNEFLDISAPGKNHDVHGPWKYQGEEEHYTLFNRSDSLFHSEFGVDGCSSLVCLKKCLSGKNLLVTSMKDNLVWRHHGEWWDTHERDTRLFGDMTSVDKFVQASQLMQAEGLRYALEANQRRMFRNSGSIVWHFDDPWPNVSSTALVDYYKIPKMCYYWVKDAYRECFASLSYNKLSYQDEKFDVRVFLHNHSGSRVERTVNFEILDIYGNVHFKRTKNQNAPENQVVETIHFCENLPWFEKGIFFVRLTVQEGEEQNKKLYFFSRRRDYPFRELFNLGESRLEVVYCDDKAILKNPSETVCLFAHADFLEAPPNGVYVENNYVSLFPGETAQLHIRALGEGLVREKYRVNYLNSPGNFDRDFGCAVKERES